MKIKAVTVLITMATFGLSTAALWAQTNQNQQSGGSQTASGFGRSVGFANLTKRQVQTQNGQQVGKIQDAVVDLESGRLLYVLLSNQGQNYAVPPTLFGMARGVTNTLVFQGTQQQLTSAPKADPNQQGNISYVSQVYQHFGQQTWWGGTATGREGQAGFGNVQKASSLMQMNVKDPANQDVGKISNVILDLHDGRVAFLLLHPQEGAQGQQAYPIPPMAFTRSPDNKFLVTGIEKSKLQSAPKVQVHQFNQLNDPNFAANVYQFYGKQPYWTTPTSSQSSSRIYQGNQNQ